MSEYILEMTEIDKSFPGVHALDHVTLKVRRGTVHALLGENGAGKSTLMKILIGLHRQDSGSIIFDGAPLKNHNMRDVLHGGISMIFQELSPVKYMTVAENIWLGREPKTKLGFLDRSQMVRRTRELFEEYNLDSISATDKMHTLTTAKMQLVEIAKAISYDSRLIIMDEPTSSLTEDECENLFKLVDSLKKRGLSFIFISHKLDEVYRIADETTIMRDGQYIASGKMSDFDQNKLISLMVGREVNQLYPKEHYERGEVAMRAEGLSRKGEFDNVSFEAHYGEILGFSGLIGAGRTEVMESLFGYRKLERGKIYIDGKEKKIASPKEAIKNGMALLTEDRKGTGLFMPMSISDNIIIPSLKKHKAGPFLNRKKITASCEEKRRQFAIKTPTLRQKVEKLSGGNQQKVLVSRWLLTDPNIIILDEPTRGIDIGAKADIYRFVSNLAANGKCVILVSSELPEILGLSDRIVVMHEGQVTGIVERNDVDQEKLLALATGTA